MARCTGCARAFGFLRAEKGCDQCGWAYCGSCLTASDARLLCRACITGDPPPPASGPPQAPASFLDHRLKTLEAREPGADLEPIRVYPAQSRGGPSHMRQLKRGLSAQDQQLVDRLACLSGDPTSRVVPPSDQDLRSRLDKLRGSAAETESAPPRRDTRPAVYRPDDLLRQMSEEVAMAHRDPDPTSDIARRLAALRGLDPQATPRTTDTEPPDQDLSDLEDEEASVKKLIQQLTDEARLEDDDLDSVTRLSQSTCRGLARESESDAEVEFPWCAICNDNATCRCLDCDRDLYCRRCFKDCHTEFELSHRSEPYSLAKTSQG